MKKYTICNDNTYNSSKKRLFVFLVQVVFSNKLHSYKNESLRVVCYLLVTVKRLNRLE